MKTNEELKQICHKLAIENGNSILLDLADYLGTEERFDPDEVCGIWSCDICDKMEIINEFGNQPRTVSITKNINPNYYRITIEGKYSITNHIDELKELKKKLIELDL